MFSEMPSLLRPTKTCPFSSGTAICSPVWRTSHSSLVLSYMNPAHQVIDRLALIRPLSITRKSRTCVSGSSTPNCPTLASSCQKVPASRITPALARRVKNGPSNSFHFTSRRAGGSADDPPASCASSTEGGGGCCAPRPVHDSRDARKTTVRRTICVHPGLRAGWRTIAPGPGRGSARSGSVGGRGADGKGGARRARGDEHEDDRSRQH